VDFKQCLLASGWSPNAQNAAALIYNYKEKNKLSLSFNKISTAPENPKKPKRHKTIPIL
jgi:hypothetical protein